MIDRNIDVIFCDDIRHESSGKITLVGTYAAGILLNSFPTTLPKLGVAIRILSDSDNIVESLYVRILLDDKVLKQWEPPESDPPRTDVSDGEVMLTHCFFVISPVHVEKPGVLKVQVTINGEQFDYPDFPIELSEAD